MKDIRFRHLLLPSFHRRCCCRFGFIITGPNCWTRWIFGHVGFGFRELLYLFARLALPLLFPWYQRGHCSVRYINLNIIWCWLLADSNDDYGCGVAAEARGWNGMDRPPLLSKKWRWNGSGSPLMAVVVVDSGGAGWWGMMMMIGAALNWNKIDVISPSPVL